MNNVIYRIQNMTTIDFTKEKIFHLNECEYHANAASASLDEFFRHLKKYNEHARLAKNEDVKNV